MLDSSGNFCRCLGTTPNVPLGTLDVEENTPNVLGSLVSWERSSDDQYADVEMKEMKDADRKWQTFSSQKQMMLSGDWRQTSN